MGAARRRLLRLRPYPGRNAGPCHQRCLHRRLHPAIALLRSELPPPSGPPRDSPEPSPSASGTARNCATPCSSTAASTNFSLTNLPAYNRQDLDYDRMPIPFRCVATDLNTLQPVTFSIGPLPQAVRASISIPGVFSPVQGSNGHYLVDGGILDNLPTDVVRRDLHADIVIAIHLRERPVAAPTQAPSSAFSTAPSPPALSTMWTRPGLLADLVITIPLDKFSATDYTKGGELIQAGYQAAEQNRAALLRYALNDAGLERLPRRAPEPHPASARHSAPGPRGRRLAWRDRTVLRRYETTQGQARHARRHPRRAQAHPVQRRIRRHLRDLLPPCRAAGSAARTLRAPLQRRRHPCPPQQDPSARPI